MVSSNNVTITESGSSLRVQGLRVFELHPSEVAALRAHFAAERMPQDVRELVERAREYLRQRSQMRGLAPEIHTVHADWNAEPVTLDLAWLAAISSALEAAYSQTGAVDDPR